jgi:indolepyruvate ferredoxin oxidoreductase beta subunit
MDTNRERPLSVAMLALGGQGGGVLTGWLVETAEANGYIAQSTYVAGVAQRTGATVYCVEMFPQEAARVAGQLPVFTPYPVPGDVDLVIAGEMAETGRAIEKGFVTPNATTLIASSHRVYSMPEKEALGDGIMDLSRVADVAARASKQFVCFDMQKAADETGSVISSVLLGAIAASGALPFDRQAFEETIRRTGKAVESNLRGFAAGFDGVNEAPLQDEVIAIEKASPRGPNGRALAERVKAELPEAVRDIALHGALRTLDYQDSRYANEYLDALGAFVQADNADLDYALTAEVARQLALQMSYEDTIRVAELKTRRERFDRIRKHVAAGDDQPVRVVEYFHPRIEEFCDALPSLPGSMILRSALLRKMLAPFFRKGRNISTTSISGFLFLYMMSKMKRIRRTTYRYKQQKIFINDWLDKVTAAVCDDYDYALSVARCIEIVKGYGETYERGRTRYLATVGAAAATKNADAVRRLHRAALADEKGRVFDETMAALEANR